MKKIVFTKAILAIVGCLILISCEKDGMESINKSSYVIVPTEDRVWPEMALSEGDDSYQYHYSGSAVPLNRIDTMLSVYFSPSYTIENLPSHYCVILPVRTDWIKADSKGAVVLFEGVSREEAIEELKGVSGVFAVNPVYEQDAENYNIAVPSPHVNVILRNFEDTTVLFRLADSLCLIRKPITTPSDWPESGTIYDFVTDHSLVNSVVAANIIYESMPGRVALCNSGWAF